MTGRTPYPRCSAELRAVDVVPMGEVERLAFWLNVYNTLVLHGAVVHAASLDSVLARWALLRLHSRRFLYQVGGFTYSAVEIEPAVLR